jgi:hypothetical protein
LAGGPVQADPTNITFNGNMKYQESTKYLGIYKIFGSRNCAFDIGKSLH